LAAGCGGRDGDAPTSGVISAAEGHNAALADMIARRRWYFRGPRSQTPAGLRSFDLAVWPENPMRSAFVISCALKFLHSFSSFGGLGQPIADLTTLEADISQLPVTETSQNDEIRLILTVCNHGGNPGIDKAGKPRHATCERASNRGRGLGIT
jgi:hypothetical protein